MSKMDTTPHFQFVTGDGLLMTRTDGSVMEFRPAAYLGIFSGDDFIFVRDCRAEKLQFLGGGVDILFDNITRELCYEMPPEAAEREALEEAGVSASHKDFSFVGSFSMLEPAFLYTTLSWWLPRGGFVAEEGEVSEVVKVPFTDVSLPSNSRDMWQDDFYPAQWTMFGWLLNHLYFAKKPVFCPWRGEGSDGWKVFDSHRK